MTENTTTKETVYVHYPTNGETECVETDIGARQPKKKQEYKKLGQRTEISEYEKMLDVTKETLNAIDLNTDGEENEKTCGVVVTSPKKKQEYE